MGHPELTVEATRTLTGTSSSESCKKQDTKHMKEEKFKLRVATLADTEEQEVILGATGHFAAAEVRR